MGSSDSDTEIECFESAEESIDEDEKSEKVPGPKASFAEVESESPEPVVPQCDPTSPVHQVNDDMSGNLMSYRKRPERVKRLHSKPSNKSISKSNDELILKADKIVSDVFLQEVTNNLSKNINKSLSTLQQTSSNVKEMILNSLPVSSFSNSEGFSYDDKNFYSTSANTFQDKHFKDAGDVADNSKEKEEKISVEELSDSLAYGQTSDSKCRKPPDGTSDRSENYSERCQNLESQGLGDAVEEEQNSKQEQIQENTDGAPLSPSILNSNKEIEECIDQNRKGNSRNFEKLEPNKEKGFVQEENSSEDTINSSESKNQDIISIHSNKTISPDLEIKNVDEKEVKETETLSKDELTSNTVLENVNQDYNDLVSFSANIGSSESLIKAKKDISSVSEEIVESDSECNMRELNSPLENNISEEKSPVEQVDGSLKENTVKEEIIFKGKLMENESCESSKEGWDDFDFSDTEDDNFGFNKTSSDSFSVTEGKKQISKSTDQVIRTESHKMDSTKSCPDKTFANDTLDKKETMTKMDKKGAKKEIIEIKPVAEDSWDWDAWDEEPADKKENVGETENSGNEKGKDEITELSKWSGWDNFGQKSEENTGNWRLGSWGVDLLLNKATAVTQGISNVLEAGLGAPDPETLARMEKMERENSKERKIKDEAESKEVLEVSKKNSLTNVNLFPVSGITSLVAGVTSKIVEHSKIQEIGSKVITGGLDTLETFGKKTMEVLQEGDPGLKNKRALLLGDQKPVLSQVLKEAREKAEREMKKEEERELARKCHFETLFDDFQGMVHLEALEMLSKQYELKLEQLKMNSENQEDFDETLKEVEELCSLYENEAFLNNSSKLEFKIKLQMAVKPLMHEIPIQRILQIHEEVCSWLQAFPERKPSLNSINQKFVSTLAQLSAAAVQVFHKSGELLSVKECRETVEEVDALLRLTDVLCTEINGLCEKFISLFKEKISNEINEDKVTSLSENATKIMNNSTSYIRQAFNLLIPVLQFGAAVY